MTRSLCSTVQKNTGSCHDCNTSPPIAHCQMHNQLDNLPQRRNRCIFGLIQGSRSFLEKYMATTVQMLSLFLPYPRYLLAFEGFSYTHCGTSGFLTPGRHPRHEYQTFLVVNQPWQRRAPFDSPYPSSSPINTCVYEYQLPGFPVEGHPCSAVASTFSETEDSSNTAGFTPYYQCRRSSCLQSRMFHNQLENRLHCTGYHVSPYIHLPKNKKQSSVRITLSRLL